MYQSDLSSCVCAEVYTDSDAYILLLLLISPCGTLLCAACLLLCLNVNPAFRPYSLQRQVLAINKLHAAGMFFWDYGNAFLLEASRAGWLIIYSLQFMYQPVHNPQSIPACVYIPQSVPACVYISLNPYQPVCISLNPYQFVCISLNPYQLVCIYPSIHTSLIAVCLKL